MRYLKHNEIFGLFKKQSPKIEKLTKDSMWIYNPSLNLIEPTQNLYKYHVSIEDNLDKDKLNRLLFSRVFNEDTAIWLKDKPYNLSGRMVRLSKFTKYLREGGRVYDVAKYFRKLKDISNKLGYKIGANVYVKEFDKVGKIEKLRDTCFCTIGRTGGLGDIALTLFYKVSIPGEAHVYGFYYNISQIELVKEQEPLDVNINDISDFFIDLIDMESIKIDYSLENDQKGQYMSCTISYLSSYQLIFNELMESYLKFSKVMKSNYGLNTIVTSINELKFSFKLKQL